MTRTQEIYEWDGLTFSKVFEVGGTLTKPPVLDFPDFGRGITFATYADGTKIDAVTEFPDAYQVMQHPGDSPP